MALLISFLLLSLTSQVFSVDYSALGLEESVGEDGGQVLSEYDGEPSPYGVLQDGVMVPEDLSIPPVIHMREPFLPFYIAECDRCLKLRQWGKVFWVYGGNYTQDDEFTGTCTDGDYLGSRSPLPIFGHYICDPNYCDASFVVVNYSPQRAACHNVADEKYPHLRKNKMRIRVESLQAQEFYPERWE